MWTLGQHISVIFGQAEKIFGQILFIPQTVFVSYSYAYRQKNKKTITTNLLLLHWRF